MNQSSDAMTHKPPSQLQLAYLRALGDDTVSPPLHMAEASQRIDMLRRQGVRQ
jgi:hypothetical protein